MQEPISINRSKLTIKKDSIVLYEEELFRIKETLNIYQVLGESIQTGKIQTLLIKDLKKVKLEGSGTSGEQDISEFTPKELETIAKRLEAIKPILNGASKDSVVEHAKNIGVHHSTLYRWCNSYFAEDNASGLLPKKRGRKKGRTMLGEEAERIIQDVIHSDYLTQQKVDIETVARKVQITCLNQDIPLPSNSTVRRRIAEISEGERVAKRQGKDAARNKFSLAPKHFTADYPLEYVQIDHTVGDIILVHEKSRLPIGRPYLTLMIDVYSRMIHGYYLSFDPPSATSVSMCIVNAVCDKDKTLKDLGIDAEWGIWGFPDNLHSDNGADFHSAALKNGCLLHDVHLEKRPMLKTEFGGHVERVLGTVMKDVHNISGTTHSNIKEKGDYDSEKESAMTLREFEKRLVTFIVKIYHKNVHKSLGMSPEQKFNEGIWGTSAKDGAGLPPRPTDPATILLDFLPFKKRKIENNGVSIGAATYYDSVLRNYREALDPVTKKKKDFIFKTDPRDITHIWLYDDKAKQYYKIPIADQEIPSMTSYEWEKVKKYMREQNEHTRYSKIEILRAYEEIYGIVDESIALTKKQRRADERKRTGKRKREAILEQPAINTTKKDNNPDIQDDSIWDDDAPVLYVE